ncbi:urease accessory protein UreF [Kitasatospora sp. NPDC056327]|uniref:urease accessory protein UreF n=1 Tax=Kitasatospora sp. NPDC056327 TaxID=3345785 RepID=UPI0035DBD87A
MYRDEEDGTDPGAPAEAPPGDLPGAGAGIGAGAGAGALLVVLQLTDSAFPSGFYTLSHGLEGYAQAGAVTPEGLPGLLAGLLRHGVGPADATALVHAHRAAAAGDLAAVADTDRRLHAAKLGREPRQAATRTGRQLLDLAAEVFGRPLIARYLELVVRREAPGTQPVAAGLVHAATGVPVRQAVTADLFAFCASFAGAALRLRLTDHRGAQVLLHGMAPVIEEVTRAALRRDLADLGSSTFAADVMSARHERAEARLFAS